MMTSLSASDRRTLLRGLAAVGLLLFAGRVVPAVHRWSVAHRATADAAWREAARAERSTRDAPVTRRLLAGVRARLVAYDSALLDATSLTRASAMLAAVVRDAADASEARVGALQLRVDSTGRGPLTRVSVRASVTGDLTSLAMFMEMLEAGPHLVAIRELGIVQPEPALPADRAELLQADLLVEGVFRTPARAP